MNGRSGHGSIFRIASSTYKSIGWNVCGRARSLRRAGATIYEPWHLSRRRTHPPVPDRPSRCRQMDVEEAIALFGTAQSAPEELKLTAGPLSCRLCEEALKDVRWRDVEVVRAV